MVKLLAILGLGATVGGFASAVAADETLVEGVTVNAQGDVKSFDWHRDERLHGRSLEGVEFYELREHPMYSEFTSKCGNDLEKFCNFDTNAEGYMHAWWACLEEQTFADLAPACKQFIKFSSNGKNPNPTFFEKVYDCADIDVAGLGIGTPLNSNCYVGYLKAPLFSGRPAASPLTQTWYLVFPATTQPAPKGMMVQHNGGPLPGIGGNVFQVEGSTPTGSMLGQSMEYINKNYDVVFTDLRGMGLSSLRYKMNFDPAQEITSANFFFTYFNLNAVNVQISADPAFNDENVPMFLKLREGGGYDTITYSGKCVGLTYPTAPQDWTSLSQVSEYTRAHAQYLRQCNKQGFTYNDGQGGMYTAWQYWGTSAAASDLEYLRYAFGSPSISLLGFSYGTRYIAAYMSSFPNKVLRAVASGTVNPSPDAAVVADYTAQNTQNIFDYVAGKCEESADCDTDMYAQASNAYMMSLNEAAGFQEKCCAQASQALISGMFRPLLVADRFEGIQYPGGAVFKDGFPVNFGVLPFVVDALTSDENLCKLTALPYSGVDSPSTFMLIPSLDMVGRSNSHVLAKNLVSVATKNPVGIDMANQYIQSTFGWPTEPVPIGFSNNNVELLVANTLYDERTSVENAYMYRQLFGNSRVITAQAGGHCINSVNSPECNTIMANFLLGFSDIEDGYVCMNRGTIDFKGGKEIFQASELAQSLAQMDTPNCVKCGSLKTKPGCVNKGASRCRWYPQLKKCFKK